MVRGEKNYTSGWILLLAGIFIEQLITGSERDPDGGTERVEREITGSEEESWRDKGTNRPRIRGMKVENDREEIYWASLIARDTAGAGLKSSKTSVDRY